MEPLGSASQSEANLDATFRTALAVIRHDLRSVDSELAECQERLSKVQRKAAELRRAESALLNLIGEKPPTPRPMYNGSSVHPKKRRIRPTPAADRHAEAIKVVMEKTGRPMKLPEIIRVLKDDGYALPPTSSDYWALSSVMRKRCDIFVLIERGLWALKS
jgi:hypothetical protein